MPSRAESTRKPPARTMCVQRTVESRWRSGITIIELLVVIGVVMILMSLWAPQLKKARAAANLTRLSVTIQQDATLVLAYTMDHRVFPVGHATMWNSTHLWVLPLVNGGYLADRAAADPVASRQGEPSGIEVSACVVADPKYFIPGFTEADPPAMGVGESMVTYPSLKGLMVKLTAERPSMFDADGWCCGRPWRTPVAMVDGSVIVGTYREFLADDTLVVDAANIGTPVRTTWRGCRGRDR